MLLEKSVYIFKFLVLVEIFKNIFLQNLFKLVIIKTQVSKNTFNKKIQTQYHMRVDTCYILGLIKTIKY